MSTVIQEPELSTGVAPIVLQMLPVLHMTDDQFFEFCQINRALRIEKNAQGKIIIMAPAGSDSSHRNANITYQLFAWALRDGTGKVYDSSGGFTLPNGATRSPDVSWVSLIRLKAITKEKQVKFLPLSPDFVIELRSPSDRLRDVKNKVQEYIENGVLLGLLLDPETKRVYIYQPNQPVQELADCDKVSCEPVLPGFELMVKEIW